MKNVPGTFRLKHSPTSQGTIIASPRMRRAVASLSESRRFLRLYKTICPRSPGTQWQRWISKANPLRSLAHFSIACDPASDCALFLIHGNFHTFAGRECYARRSREKEQHSGNTFAGLWCNFLTRILVILRAILFRMKERWQGTKRREESMSVINW